MVAVYLNPQWVSAFTFGAIILVLAIRPSGLFAKGSASEAHEGSTWIGRATPRGRRLLNQTGGTGDRNRDRHRLFPVAANGASRGALRCGRDLRDPGLRPQPLVPPRGDGVAGARWPHGHRRLHGRHSGMPSGARTFWLVLPIAFVFSAIVGMLVAYPATRSQGHYFLLITFALGELIVVVAENWKSVTKGDSGLLLLDRPNAIGPFTFDSLESTYYLYLVILLGVVRGDRVGRTVRAGRPLPHHSGQRGPRCLAGAERTPLQGDHVRYQRGHRRLRRRCSSPPAGDQPVWFEVLVEASSSSSIIAGAGGQSLPRPAVGVTVMC